MRSMTNLFEEMRALNDTPSKWFGVIASNQIIDSSKIGIIYRLDTVQLPLFIYIPVRKGKPNLTL